MSPLEYLKELRSLSQDQWTVLPKWVRAVTFVVGAPAWIFFAVSVVNGEIGGRLQLIAFGIFGLVAFLQIVFLIRAYWRNDIY
jgi:hypothetical protein